MARRFWSCSQALGCQSCPLARGYGGCTLLAPPGEAGASLNPPPQPVVDGVPCELLLPCAVPGPPARLPVASPALAGCGLSRKVGKGALLQQTSQPHALGARVMQSSRRDERLRGIMALLVMLGRLPERHVNPAVGCKSAPSRQG